MSVSEQELEQLYKNKASDDDEFDDVTDDSLEDLQEAAELIKNTAVLLEFISNPDFCKSITQGLRATISKHVEKLDELSDKLDERIDALTDDE
jgi:hypothetical protein